MRVKCSERGFRNWVGPISGHWTGKRENTEERNSSEAPTRQGYGVMPNCHARMAKIQRASEKHLPPTTWNGLSPHITRVILSMEL